MATGGNVSSIKALLADVEQFSIPDFQRNYAWENREIDDFLTDVNSATRLNKQHFIGALILLSKSDPGDVKRNYEVIDGQQRLTTIFMYLAILRDAANAQGDIRIDPPAAGGMPIDVMSKIGDLLFSNPGIGKPRFKSNRILRAMFQERIMAHPTPNRPVMPARDKTSTLALRKAYTRLRSSLDDELNKIDTPIDRLRKIYQIFDTVASSFNLLCIYTSTYGEAFDIFMTLNSRGRALGPADLVKTLLMKYLTDGESDDNLLRTTEQISIRWEQITSNLDSGDVDQFLRHFMLSIQDEAVQSKNIYNSVDRHISMNNGVLLGANELKVHAKEMLTLLEESSEVYKKLLQPSLIADTRTRRSAQSMLQVLISYRILMMRVLRDDCGLTPPQRRDIARLTEVLSLRWVLVGGNAQELENHFQTACTYERDATKSFDDLKNLLIAKIPENDRVRRAFRESVSADMARAVFYGMNVQLGDPAALVQFDPSRLHVEHVAPATSTVEWVQDLYGIDPAAGEDTPLDYSIKVEMWGNKTLLESDINVVIKQSQFPIKRDGDPLREWPGYLNSVLAVTRDLQKFDAWTLDEIEKRTDWVCESFLKIWDVSQDLAGVVNYSEWTSPHPQG